MHVKLSSCVPILGLVLFLFSNCSMKHTQDENQTTNDINKIHDIWALKTINGIEFSKTNKQPVLEIYAAEKRVVGNDGCNNISGELEELTNTILRFGPMMGTKMACPNMEISDSFNQRLSEVRSFKIVQMELILFDSLQSEILRFKKVD